MRFPRKRGSTSVMIRVFIPDNTSTTGAGLTGLTSASTNLTIGYIRELDSAFTTYTGANIEEQTTVGTYQAPSSSSKIRFKAVDATSGKGWYEIQFHDSATAFGTGDTSQSVGINIYEATTSALKIGPNGVLIPLVPWDYQDGVRMGLTALPNAAAAAAGGLPTFGTSTGQINPSGGKIPATLASTDVTGNVACDLQTIKTQAVTCSAGVTVGAFVGNANAAIQVTAAGLVNILGGFKKNVGFPHVFYMPSSSDNKSPVIGATITATRSIDSAAFTAAGGSVTEMGSGYYFISFTNADVNGVEIVAQFAATGANTQKYTFITTG